jgi:hypothetical protein
MNERNLHEGQWEDRKQWNLGVGQRRKTFWNRYILLLTFFIVFIFTFAPCILLHLLYLKPTHALVLNILSYPHFKTLKFVKKCFVKTSKLVIWTRAATTHNKRQFTTRQPTDRNTGHT